jgi:hypothetical protein
MRSHTLARIVHGCVVETVLFSCESALDLEAEMTLRNGYPGYTQMGGYWVALDGKFVEEES